MTLGHMDIIRRSSNIVDELIVGVLNNNAKTPLFSVEERVRMLEEATKELKNVRVIPFEGLLIDFVRKMMPSLSSVVFVRLQILNMSFRWRRRIISWRRILRQHF